MSSGHWMPASDFDHAALGVEPDDPVQRPGIEQDRPGGELLPAHGVASARHAHRLAFGAGRRQRLPQRRLRVHRDDPVDPGRIELRMDIVDEGVGVCAPRGMWRQREAGSGPGRDLKELAACRHIPGAHRFGAAVLP